MDPIGPLWYRGLTRGRGRNLRQHLEKVLTTHGASRIVVGHTLTRGGVGVRLGGRVIMIDVGISRHARGLAACLLVEQGRWYEVRKGKRRKL
jgi:hypothetical protein